MQVRGEYNQTAIIDALSIRDTSAKASTVANVQGLSKKSIVVINGLNQNVAIQIQGSADNNTFINVGTAQTVNATTNAIIGENEVAQLKNYFPYLRVTATCSVAPASDTLTVQLAASL